MNPEQQTPQPTPQQLAPQTIQLDPAQVTPVAPSVQQPQMQPQQPLATQSSNDFVKKFKDAGRSSLAFGILLGTLLLIGIASFIATNKDETISPIIFVVPAVVGAVSIGLIIIGAKLKKSTEFQSGNTLVSRLLILSGLLLAITLLRLSVLTAMALVLFVYLLTVKLSLDKLRR